MVVFLRINGVEVKYDIQRMHEDEISRHGTIQFISPTARLQNAVTKDTCSDGLLRDMPTELLCTHQGQPSVNKSCDH